MKNKYCQIETFAKKASIEYHYNEPLSRHSTFKIGGNADMFLFPRTVSDLSNILDLAIKNNIKHTIIGNGSNVLFSDNGYRGIIISTSKICSITVDKNIIIAECGAPFTKISRIALKHGFTGLEFAYGIPGTIGGAVYMNAGAYGSDISNVIESAYVYNVSTRETNTFSKEEMNFSYRTSVFQTHDNLIILSARICLIKGNVTQIEQQMHENMLSRHSKQPLELPNAGSVFKRHESLPIGKIIDECGLKGYTVGGAQISTKHAGFIVNTGNATSSDVLHLIELIKETIKQKYGFLPQCEIRYVE